MADEEPEPLTGRLIVKVGDRDDPTVYSLLVDRMAASRAGVVHLLAVVGPGNSVGAFRAALQPDVRASFSFEDVRAGTDAESGWARGMALVPDGYKMSAHGLGHGMVHALFLSRDPGFLRADDDDHLYRALKHPRYTTPLLRAWVPEIRRKLAEQGLLKQLHGHRARCALLTATTEELDKIVAAGVRGRSLAIR